MNSGFILALTAALLWGASYTLCAKVLKGVEPLMMLSIASAFRLLWFTCLFALFARDKISQLSMKSVGLIGIETLFSTAATLAIMTAITRIGASRASLLEISYPIFVVVLSALFMRTPITANMIIGGAIVLLGVAIISGESHV